MTTRRTISPCILELSKLIFDNHEVRILGTPDNPLFIAKDIGKILNIKKILNTISNFDESKKVSQKVGTLGGPQNMTLLTKKGVLSVIFISNKPEALRFQDCVLEVLDKIQRTGKYDISENIIQEQTQEIIIANEKEIIPNTNNISQEELPTVVAEKNNQIVANQSGEVSISTRELEIFNSPVIQFQRIEFYKYVGKPCVYLFYIVTIGMISEFKFGVSGEIDVRIKKHEAKFAQLGFTNSQLYYIWECKSMQIMKDVEMMIKNTAHYNRIKLAKYGKKELIATNNIELVMTEINNYVKEKNDHEGFSSEITKIQLNNPIRELELTAPIKILDQRCRLAEIKKPTKELKMNCEVKKLELQCRLAEIDYQKTESVSNHELKKIELANDIRKFELSHQLEETRLQITKRQIPAPVSIGDNVPIMMNLNQCPTCNQIFSTKKHLDQHLNKKTRCNPNIDRDKKLCNVCDKFFGKSYFRLHKCAPNRD